MDGYETALPAGVPKAVIKLEAFTQSPLKHLYEQSNKKGKGMEGKGDL